MISKGTTHNNGLKLAQYMVTGKEGERANLWRLFGFAADNITDAFRDVQIMADGTKCQKPFFHVQVRNPDGEELTREQWDHVAKRIQSILGLSGQPGAISFHIQEQTGHEHMHIAFSRIDQDTMKAIPLPFFKRRLKTISRELEKEMGLTIVANEREGPIQFAPTRAEEEQARRLGLDIHQIRQTIRDCYDRSDCGRSFEAALAHEGLILARGERRDFIVLDAEAGMHALGKRILGVTAAQTRERLSDLDRQQLPTVEQARLHICEREMGREYEKREPMPDRYRDEIKWEDALATAAIEKEKRERQFVQPQQRKERQGSRKKEWSDVPQPARNHWALFHEAAAETTRDSRVENLKGTAAQIWSLWCQSDSAKAYRAALDERGIALAVVTKDEAERSHREASFAKEIGNHSPKYREGEIVIVTKPSVLYRRDGEIYETRQVHKLDQSMARKFLQPFDKSEVQGIDATKKVLHERATQHSAEWQALRIENATRDRSGHYKGRKIRKGAINLTMPTRAVGKTLDLFASAFESFFAGSTPEQREAAHEDQKHEADFEKYLHQQRQRVEEKERQHREHGRGRDDRDR